jgi:GNAT superfamily N-acetyltransferase
MAASESDQQPMEYTVRTARADDAEAFIPLLSSLGYPNTLSSLKTRISRILQNPDAVLLVASTASSNAALGLLSLHFIPQLGVEGDVARIGFLVVDETSQGAGIGKLLESHGEKLSRERGCNRMVLPLTDLIHCRRFIVMRDGRQLISFI